MRALLLLAALAAALPLSAQYDKHFVTIGGGAAIPGGALNGAFSPSGFFRAAYGYRFLKNFQADTGVDIGFSAAGVKDFYASQFGPLRVRDYEYMIPVGGRVVLPFGEYDRVILSAGAGGAYLRYSERSSQPFSNSGIRLDCAICTARSGWGTYGLAGASIALTPGGHFRFGGTVKVYRATTDGQSIGALAPGPSSDRWINAALELTLAF